MPDVDVVCNVHQDLEKLLVPVGELAPYAHNPRRGDIEAIAVSLTGNGQYKPIVANRRTSEVLAGNHTFQAALSLGWTHVAVTWVDVDDEAAARIVLVDNRAADLAGYDDDALAELLQSLPDLEGTGYDDEDLAGLLPEDEVLALTDPDEAPAKPKRAVSKEGDVWLLGRHRLLVGDSTDAGAVAIMLDGDQPDVVWTDPPYGVSYVGGNTQLTPSERRAAGGLEISNDAEQDQDELLAGFLATIRHLVRPAAPVYIAHADRQRGALERHMLEAGLLFRQELIWVKSRITFGRTDYQSQHEPFLEGQVPVDVDVDVDDDDSEVVAVIEHQPLAYGFVPGRKGDGRLGRGGARWHGDNKQSTVFEVPKPTSNREHPTMKPIELITRMLRNSCPPGGLVLDLFGGSGSTLIAAHHMRVRAALVELDPKYADVICRRWQNHTGVRPILQATGEPHDFSADAA